jgi:hypothetical protein
MQIQEEARKTSNFSRLIFWGIAKGDDGISRESGV